MKVILIILMGTPFLFAVCDSKERKELAGVFLRPSEIPQPENNKLNADRIAVGKKLFFDKRLSKSGDINCATCHNPKLGWGDGLPTFLGHNSFQGQRNSPTLYNAAYQELYFWDGRAPNLEEQALGPIQAPGEMAQDLKVVVKLVRSDSEYIQMLAKAYPGEKIESNTIGKAIASFERTIIAANAPFDKWLKGDNKAISASAERGLVLFRQKAQCEICHSGFNFSDNGFHNIGLKDPKKSPDIGRYSVVKVNTMKGAFKTPTLRNITLTGPYMHDGSYRTLRQVIDHYDRGGDVKANLDPNIKPLKLSEAEKIDLEAFLLSLTDEEPFGLNMSF